ncbi:MAG: hypothetical protein AB7D51_01725 [Desulfovibrionaceae bacterium]
MTNTSRTAGYLTPTNTPTGREQLENALQAMVAGITGLAGQLVRPRWQDEPPRRPERGVSWCAIGVQEFLEHATSTRHESEDDGRSIVTTTQTMTVLATFYGPECWARMIRLRDGLLIGQNRDQARAAGLILQEVGTPRNAPEQVNGVWEHRTDLPLVMQWETRQAYGVNNILDVSGESAILASSGGVRTIKTQE